MMPAVNLATNCMYKESAKSRTSKVQWVSYRKRSGNERAENHCTHNKEENSSNRNP